jgi:hypothetical protein
MSSVPANSTAPTKTDGLSSAGGAAGVKTPLSGVGTVLSLLTLALKKRWVQLFLLMAVIFIAYNVSRFRQAKEANPDDPIGRHPDEAAIRNRYADMKEKSA